MRTSDDNRIFLLEMLTQKTTAGAVQLLVAPCPSLFDQILAGKLGKQEGGGGGGKQVGVYCHSRYYVSIMVAPPKKANTN